MAEISDQELEQLRKVAKREETRKRKAREASKKYKEKRLKEGYKRISLEVNFKNFTAHKTAGDVPVGIVWCPSNMLKSALDGAYLNVIYTRNAEQQWEWGIEKG